MKRGIMPAMSWLSQAPEPSHPLVLTVRDGGAARPNRHGTNARARPEVRNVLAVVSKSASIRIDFRFD
jgi:hypothetical protein